MENKQNNKEKRIAMFSIHSDPLAPLGSQESGGQNIYIYSLVKELDKKGLQVDVFTRWDEAHKKSVAAIGKRSRVIRLKGGPCRYVSKGHLFDFFPELYDNFLNAIDHKNPYCIFHGHYWDGGWMALKAHKDFNKPLIENFHSLGQIRFQTKKQYLNNGNEKEFFEKRFALEKEIIKDSSLIISLSESEKKDLESIYGASKEKIAVIPGGVDLKELRPVLKEKARHEINVSKNDFVVLFVGRLEWRKGAGTLISAAKMLKNEIPNLKVVIVGGKIYGRQKNAKDCKEYQRLLEKAEEEGIKDNVEFIGRIDHGRLCFFYSAADAFVIPSYYEPFGLVALEGMACKVPVIASRVGGLQTTIDDGATGLLFKPRNALDLKEKILQIYKSKELAEKLSKNAYNKVIEQYSWKNIASKIYEAYQPLIKENCNENSAYSPN